MVDRTPRRRWVVEVIGIPGESWATGKRRRKRGKRRAAAADEEKTEYPPISGSNIVVLYAPLRCPLCGYAAKHTGRKEGSPLRYHQCKSKDCGQRFRSWEQRGSMILVCPGRQWALLRSAHRLALRSWQAIRKQP